MKAVVPLLALQAVEDLEAVMQLQIAAHCSNGGLHVEIDAVVIIITAIRPDMWWRQEADPFAGVQSELVGGDEQTPAFKAWFEVMQVPQMHVMMQCPFWLTRVRISWLKTCIS